MREVVTDAVIHKEVTLDELDRIAETHLEVLPDDFSSFLGQRFLVDCFYPALFRSADF